MSTSNETTSFVNEAESNETDSSLEKKVGLAKKFDKEMKDYAKATVKEFLGIYGYEEDVDINMEDSTEGLPNRSESSTISSNPTQTEANFKQPENRSPCEAISSADYGKPIVNAERRIEERPYDCSSVITHQTSGPINYTVVLTYSSDDAAVGESSEFNGRPSSYLGKSSECVDRPSSCFGRSSDAIGQPSSFLGRSSRSIGQSSSFVGKSSETIVQPLSLLEESSETIRQPGSESETEVDLQDKEQLEKDVCEGLMSNGMSDSGNISVISGTIRSLSRKDKSRLRMQWKRLNETPEKRALRQQVQRDRARFRRANENEDDREYRLLKDRLRQRTKRTNEHDDIREKRLLMQRLSAQQRRALESPEQKQSRLLKDKERTRKRREEERAGVVKWWSDDGT